MAEQLRVLMLGAHQDDNDFLSGGIALKYIKQYIYILINNLYL